MGLVPTPAIGQQTFILRGDATWVSAAAVALPDQAGASGKILSSDGVNALWSNSVGPITSTAFIGPIGSTTASSGAFTALSATDQLTSTVADGTAPFVVTSTTKVVNLNASSLDGKTFAEPGTIGGTTAGEAFFSQVTAASTVAAAITKTPVAYASGGNITIRFDLGSYGQIDLTTNAVFVSSSGMVRGRTQILDLTNPSGGAFTLSWPGAWKLLNGALPTSIAAGQSIRVELNCGGTTEASIIAGYSLSGFVAGVLAPASGGTGVNNGSSTLTFAGNVTHAGAYTQTFTATANTALTLPTTGTLATLAGSEALSNKAITLSSFSGTTGAFTTLTATSLNKVAITAPATGATLTIAEGATLTASATATVSGTNTGDQTISISGDVTAAGSTGALTSQVTKINGTSLAGLATGILKNTTATGVPSIAVAGDFPTLNQNTTGNAGTATELQTTRTIGGSNFNGGANVTSFPAPGAIGGTTPSTGAFTSVTTLSDSGYQAVVGQLTTGDRVGISGQASGSGTALVFFDNAQTTFRPAIFDASSHSFKISGVATTSITSTGLQGAIGASSPSTGAFTTVTASSTIAATGAVTGSNLSGTNTGDQTTITGNAGTATILQTARNINGVSFNGSADITVTAAAGTLTGATLASGVTASSLTSLGTITSLTATALTVNDNTTLGSSNSDTVNFNARIASDLNPSTDNTYDLGVTGHEWRNLNIDGTANIDSLVADTADINGGTIDGTAIGSGTASTGAFTSVSGTTGTFTGAGIFGNSATGSNLLTIKGGTSGSADGSAVYISNGTSTIGAFGNKSSILGGGYDANAAIFAGAGLSIGLYPDGGSTARALVTSTGLNSTAIGATTPSTVAATSLSTSGNLTFTGTSNRITGDFSNATLANRVAVQTSTTNGNTSFSLLTNGTGTISSFVTNSSSDPANSQRVVVASIGGANNFIRSEGIGTGLTQPLDIQIGATVIGSFSSTGLAVTGALSSTGAGFNGGKATFESTNSGNSIDIKGVNGAGINDSAFITLRDGTSGRDSFIGLTGDNAPGGAGNIRFATGGNVVRAILGSTGLAVTGALSSTGVISKGTGNSTSGNIKINYAGSGASLGMSICETTDNSGTFFVAFQKSTGADIGSISRVTTTDAVAYNTTSDGRLKENFRDFTDSGRLIDSLKPRVFDWKNSDENGKNVVGFIAQEEHAADPIFAHIGAVSVGDEDPETITKQWQRSDSALIPILVAELKSVRARLAALESK
jgi:hypothetical protein